MENILDAALIIIPFSMTLCPRARSAIFFSSFFGIMAPVGLQGLFRMIAFVFDVMCSRRKSALTAKLLSSVLQNTGFPSQSLTCSAYVIQIGAGISTSSLELQSTAMLLYRACFAPAETAMLF